MKKLNKKGFTLVEMLVVIAIIAILVAVIIPVIGKSTAKSAAAANAANLRSIKAELTSLALNSPSGLAKETNKPIPSGIEAPLSKKFDSCDKDLTATYTYDGDKITVMYGGHTINQFAEGAEKGTF